MPRLSDFEAFYNAYAGLIDVVLALLSIAVGVGSYLWPRQSPKDRFEKERAQKEQEFREELLRAVAGQTEETARLRGQIAALQADTFERRKERSESAAAVLDRLAPKGVRMARNALAKGRAHEAENLFRGVLEDDSRYAPEAAYQLGALAENRFDFAAAKDWYFKSVELEPENPMYLAAAGRLALNFGEIASVEDLFGKAIDRLSDESELRARVLNGLGNIRYAHGQYEEAEDYHRQALAIQCKVLGKEHPDTAQSRFALGVDCSGQGRYREAEGYYRQALAIQEKVLGKEHPATVQSLSSLGSDCDAQGRYREAEGYFRQALAIREKGLGKGHPDTARLLGNLGTNCHVQGKYGRRGAIIVGRWPSGRRFSAKSTSTPLNRSTASEMTAIPRDGIERRRAIIVRRWPSGRRF